MLTKEIQPFIRYATISAYLPNSTYTMSYDCRLFYVLDGKGVVYIEGVMYEISNGYLMLWQPGTRYCLISDKDEPLNLIILNFDYTLNNDHINEPIIPNILAEFQKDKIVEVVEFSDSELFNTPTCLNDMQIVEKVLIDIVYEFTVKKLHYKEVISGLVHSIFGIIARTATISTKNTSDKIDIIINYIQKNYDKDIDNQSLSKIVNYHSYYINRLMKLRTGSSLHKYLLSYRIDVALKLILTTDASISDIAESVGFKSLAHFSNCFKKKMGNNPSDYRTNQVRRLL